MKTEQLLKDIIKELDEARYRHRIILSALRNILEQNNVNGVNNCLINIIDRAKL
jgi:hypothetical protein